MARVWSASRNRLARLIRTPAFDLFHAQNSAAPPTHRGLAGHRDLKHSYRIGRRRMRLLVASLRLIYVEFCSAAGKPPDRIGADAASLAFSFPTRDLKVWLLGEGVRLCPCPIARDSIAHRIDDHAMFLRVASEFHGTFCRLRRMSTGRNVDRLDDITLARVVDPDDAISIHNSAAKAGKRFGPLLENFVTHCGCKDFLET